jgi:hypothetical protein
MELNFFYCFIGLQRMATTAEKLGTYNASNNLVYFFKN